MITALLLSPIQSLFDIFDIFTREGGFLLTPQVEQVSRPSARRSEVAKTLDEIWMMSVGSSG